jgi:hypothetical protein
MAELSWSTAVRRIVLALCVVGLPFVFAASFDASLEAADCKLACEVRSCDHSQK